jgi:3-methyladenine DNA glycosylase AlkD
VAVQHKLIEALRTAFEQHADASRAAPMQAYMKSAMPFCGIGAPLRRKLTAAVVRARPLPDQRALADTMRHLWRIARCREERYAAMELGRVGANAQLFGLRLLPVYEKMIRDGRWWDFCDDISGNAIARLLQMHPRQMKPLLRRWARGDDRWLRRAAILCQRRLKTVDPRLLYDCILPSIGEAKLAEEFFLRKGIGWALRERSYAAPDEVAAFCGQHAQRLSPLTRREALKAIAIGAERAPR